MNKSNVEHLFLALILQAIPGFLFGDWLIGAVFACGIFLGREHSQREEDICPGNRSRLVGYEALDFWRWKRDAILDLLFPVIGVWAVVLLVLCLKHYSII